MRTMTRIALCMTLISAVAVAGNEKPRKLTDPVEILKKADAATKAVKSVKFHVSAEANGDLAARSGKVSGAIAMTGYNAEPRRNSTLIFR